MTSSAPTPAPKTALVLGLTGGYGRVMAAELARRGWALRALARTPEKARAVAEDLGVGIEILPGSVRDAEALDRAATGVDVIVHGVNAPYDRWAAEIVPMAEVIADGAARVGATILFPGNVYNFAPGTTIGVDTRMDPPTEKGALRVAVEEVLRAATQRGARLIVLRGGDFYGAGHASSWMVEILKNVRKGGAIQMPLGADVRHAWCYLPDFARAHVDLLERSDELPRAADLPFAGHVLTGRTLTAALREALGDPHRKASPIPWFLLRIMGLFVPMLREVVAMRYLWTEEVLLDPAPLAAALGRPPKETPVVDALRAELALLGILEGRGPAVAPAAA